ncbi:prolactin-releasing peptide receptor-like [Glandiceps talaboti]
MDNPTTNSVDGALWSWPYEHNLTNSSTQNPFEGLLAGKALVRKLAWLLAILYAVVFVIGTVGNALIVVTVACHKSMQNVTNYFIANLAASDLLMCIFCIPWTLANSLMDDWIFGDAMCRLMPTMQAVSVFVSITSHVVIACDRYSVIMYPLSPRLPRYICVLIIFLSWTLAVALTSPIAYYTRRYDLRLLGYHIVCFEMWPLRQAQYTYTYVLILLVYVIPLIVVIVVYGRISYLLTVRAVPGVFTEEQARRDLKKKQKTNRLLIAVVVTFAVCWFPLYSVQMVSDINPKVFGSQWYDLIYIMCHWFATSSTVYNPFVYAWLHEKYRHRLKTIFTANCLRRPLFSRTLNHTPATPLQTREFYMNNSPRSTRFSSLRSSKGHEAAV